MSWRSKSYEVLPALSIRGQHLRQALRTATTAWIFGIIWASCVAGSRITIFGRMLGFDDFHFGLMSAIPFVVRFGQLIAVILIERTGLRKYQFIYCGTLHRAMWIAIAAIPVFLPLPSQLAVWTMLALLTASWFMSSLCEPAWMTWMGDVIPRRIRGRFLASRARVAHLVKIPVIIGLGLMLDHITHYDSATGEPLAMTAASQPTLLWGICGLFALAGVIGSIDILKFRKIREFVPSTGDGPRQRVVDISVAPSKGNSLLNRVDYTGRYLTRTIDQLLIDPLRDRKFRRYVFFGAIIMFAVSAPAPYFFRHCLENLGLSQFGTDILFLVIGPLMGIVSAKGWGRLLDRWGRRPVLVLATAGTIFAPIPYFLSTKHTPTPQFIIDGANRLASIVGSWMGHPDLQWLTPEMPVGAWLVMSTSMLIGGCAWFGVLIAQSNIVMGFADDSRGRSKLVAAYAVTVSIGGIIGGLAGGIVAKQLVFLQDSPIILGSFLWNNWHATFALSMLARIAALGSLIHMPDEGAGTFRNMTASLGTNMYRQAVNHIFYPLRIFNWARVKRGTNTDPSAEKSQTRPTKDPGKS